MHARPAYRLVEKNFLLPPDELFAQLDQLIANNRHFEFFWFPYADVAPCARRSTRPMSRRPSRAAPRRCANAARKRGADAQRVRGHQRSAALRAVPAAAGAPAVLAADAGAGQGALEPRDLPEPAHHALQRNGICGAAMRKGPDCLHGDRGENPQAADQHRLSHRIPHRRRRRCLAEPVLPARQRHHRRASVSPGGYGASCSTPARRYSARYEGRPHWGKRHTRSAGELAQLYPEFDAFGVCAAGSIRAGKFLNGYLREIVRLTRQPVWPSTGRPLIRRASATPGAVCAR